MKENEDIEIIKIEDVPANTSCPVKKTEVEVNDIEIRSEDVQEVLGATPRWIIRAGTTVIFAVILSILIGSWFFKYPDIIQSKITLTTEDPPVSLKALTSGKITELFYSEKQNINTEDVIAIIENTANYKDIIHLKTILDTLKDITLYKDTSNLKLGELQQYHSSFSRLLKDYNNFKELDYYSEKIKSVYQQIKDYNIYYDRLWTQRNIREEELNIAQAQFDRDESLYKQNIYSKTDIENSEKTFLQQKLSFESSRTTLANTQMQINQLNQQILDLKLQETQDIGNKEISIDEALQNLKSQIKAWEKTYLLKSPISGIVTFTKIWSKNQNVQIGEIVATIIPDNETNIIGKVEIPATGVGKVKINQDVNIKLDNFPYMEFGLLRGTIKSISLIPIMTKEGAIYTAEIEIPDVLISNYGKNLKFSQEMTGVAEIITDDVRLLERFVAPLKSIWKKNVKNE